MPSVLTSAYNMDYIKVTDDSRHEPESGAACYTSLLLKSALQLAGCKTRIAHKARLSRRSCVALAR